MSQRQKSNPPPTPTASDIREVLRVSKEAAESAVYWKQRCEELRETVDQELAMRLQMMRQWNRWLREGRPFQVADEVSMAIRELEAALGKIAEHDSRSSR